MITNFKSEKQIKEYVRKMFKARKPHISYYMKPGDVKSKNGIADFTACIKGLFVAIEAKSPKRGIKGLTPLQALYRDEVIKSNGKHFLVYNAKTLSLLRDWLDEIIKERSLNDEL